MKKLSHIFLATALILANLLTIFPNNVSAGANDFYFKKFNADYYLKKQSDNSSEMIVEETLTAVFPNYNQNHGIERNIPFLNQNDTNLTMEDTTKLDITITRNGVAEPFTVKPYDDHFLVRIGDPDVYVHGENTYVLKYKFVHVITEFELSAYANEAYQELYWDSNGTGWSQRFDEVNVNLHMDNSIYNNLKTDREISRSASYKTKELIHKNNQTSDKIAAWCYVGKYGANNQDRCVISDIEDGLNFNTKNLKPGENLTFVTNFNNGTFKVPKNDYVMDLTFKRVDVNYHLSKDQDGHSKMKVVEKYQALFPTRNSFRTFTKKISRTDSTNTRFITNSQEALGASLTMDGKEIKVLDSTDDDESYFTISNYSNDEYLHGEHTFVLTYELQDAIEQRAGYQTFIVEPLFKFYHDVNDFSATLHLEDGLEKELHPIEFEDVEESAVSCYSGSMPTNNDSQKNCLYTKYGNEIIYTASDISSTSNVRLRAFFEDGTFVIPDANRNYVYYHVFAVVAILCGTAFFVVYKKAYRKVGDKIKYLKNRPIVPEYTPLKDLTVGQAAKAYLGHTKNPRVATMLELIVNKKISLKKGKKKTFGGYEWSGEVIDLSNISDEQRDLMTILNGGKALNHIGDTFEIKSRSYSSSLESAFENYDRHTKHKMESEGYFEKLPKDKSAIKKKVLGIFAFIIFFNLFIISVPFLYEWYTKATNYTPFSVYEGEFLSPFIILILIITFIAVPILSGLTAKYDIRTEKALDTTQYLKGLKLYIKMAETERIAFLQSVENVDTSEEGIVKLNEKLLPYAALFGLEKTWMRELEKYYELHDDATPDWYIAGFNYSVINSITHTATSRPIDTSSSSGGGFSSSSGSSGGGGGGFSGGGGGGGGGGGW